MSSVKRFPDLYAVLDAQRLQFPLRELILRYRFSVFVILTLIIQQICLTYFSLRLYGYGVVMKLEMLGPMIAASFLIWLQFGPKRVIAALSKLLTWRVHPIWYFHALFWMPMAAFIGVIARNVWLGQPAFDIDTYWQVIPDTGFLNFLAVLMLSVSEEYAWFGYGFAVLYGRFGAFRAALTTGLFWGISYIPMWIAGTWIADGQPLWTVIAAFIAWALICAWIYNRTRSALLLALMQIASNYSYSVFLTLPHLTGETLTLSFVTVALVLMSLAVVWVYGPEHLSGGRKTWKGEWDDTQIPH